MVPGFAWLAITTGPYVHSLASEARRNAFLRAPRERIRQLARAFRREGYSHLRLQSIAYESTGFCGNFHRMGVADRHCDRLTSRPVNRHVE
jgi:hypothetical protein